MRIAAAINDDDLKSILEGHGSISPCQLMEKLETLTTKERLRFERWGPSYLPQRIRRKILEAIAES
jgi:hypothetical protein